MNIVYGLSDPRGGGIRYVGMTAQTPAQRLASHRWSARKTDYPVNRWIRLLLADGVQPVMEILEEVPDLADLGPAEVRWIQKMRDEGVRLLNATPGGDGRRGPLSEETRRRMSESQRGRPKSAEHRAAISAAQAGRKAPPRTPEWRAAHAEKMRGKKHTAETREKIGTTNRGRTYSAETIARMAAGQRRRYAAVAAATVSA